MAGNEPFVNRGVLWVVHIGNNDRIALRAKEEGFVCIGWTEIGDLSYYNTREKMRAAMEKAYPNWKPRTISASYGQPFRFAHEMETEDPIVFPIRPTGEIAIGRISGPYKYAKEDPDLKENDYFNIRPVQWLKFVSRTEFSQPALHSFGSFMSVSSSNDYLDEVIAVLKGESWVSSNVVGDESAEEETEGISLYETATQETEDYLLKAWQRRGSHFEEVVAAVFEAIGYTTCVTPETGDHGIDIIAHPDPLGLEKPFVKVQVKSGTGSVGEPEINQLKGCLNYGEHGIFVSLGRYVSNAQSIARANPNLTLIDGKRFVELFLQFYDKLDPTWRAKYPLKRVFVPVK